MLTQRYIVDLRMLQNDHRYRQILSVRDIFFQKYYEGVEIFCEALHCNHIGMFSAKEKESLVPI